MLGLGIGAAINVGLVSVAFWMSSRANRRRNLWWLAFSYVALLVVSSLVGIAVGVLISLDPFAGEVGEPPAPMSCAATGLMAFLLPTIVAILLYRKSP